MADCSELASLIYQAARTHAAAPGVDSIDKVHESMRGELPFLDRTLLINSIAEASAARHFDLTDTQKQVSKVMKEGQVDKKTLARLEALNAHLDAGTDPKVVRTPVEYSEWRKMTNMEVKRVREAINNSEPGVKRRLQRNLGKALDRLENNDFAVPVDASKVPASKEIQDLEFELSQAKSKIQGKIRAAAPRTTLQKVIDVVNAHRTWMTASDLMPVGRQGQGYLLTEPHKVPSLILKTLRNYKEKDAYLQWQDLTQDPDFKEAVRAGVPLREEAIGSEGNELLNSQLLKKLSEVGGKAKDYNTVAVSGRWFNGYMNEAKLRLYKSAKYSTDLNGNITPEEAQAIAKNISWLSGDVKIIKGESAGAASLAALAPNYMLSRVLSPFRNQAIMATELASLPMKMFGREVKAFGGTRVRRAAVKQLARRTATMMAAISTISFLGSDDMDDFVDEIQSVFNPMSANFLRPKSLGRRWDLTRGAAGVYSAGLKSVFGYQINSAGKVVPTRGPEKGILDPGPAQLFGRELRKGISLPLSLFSDLTSGETLYGDKITAVQAISNNLVVPFVGQDVYGAATDDGMDSKTAKTVAALALMMGQNNYSTERSKSNGKFSTPQLK